MAARPGSGRPVAGGTQAAAFKAETLSGQTIDFPAGYKGRIVLLDFWATWCPPCRAEIPHIVAAYDKFHDRGFDVVGITLDGPRIPASTIAAFIKDHKMPWPQVYQGAGEIAADDGVDGIPAGFLVDGDTGAVLASGDDVRGDKLAKTIAAHLKK